MICALALAGCSDSEPRLLDPSDLEGVKDVGHNDLGRAGDGWAFCRHLQPNTLPGPETAKTELSFGEHGIAGAVLIDGTSTHDDADETLRLLELTAEGCAEFAQDEPGYVFEPLTGLDADAVGWRTAGGGRRGDTVIRGRVRGDQARRVAAARGGVLDV